MGSLSKPQSTVDPDSAINPVGVLGTQPPISTPIVLTGVKAQTGINQLRGSTIAGSTGIGIPRQVTNLSATMANASVGSTSKVTITFQRNPADTAFGGVVVYAKGYQGNQTPTQVASGTSSPLNVILNNTGESVSLIVQATGNGGSAPLSNAPSCGIRLPKNSSNGGYGTSTTTNLTLAQIPTNSVTGSLSFGTLTSPPSSLNLSTEGTRDWLALSPNNSGGSDWVATTWRSKATGDPLLPMTFRTVAATPQTASTAVLLQGSNAFASYSMPISATSGDEAANVSDNFSSSPSNGASPLTNSNQIRGVYSGGVSGQIGFGFIFTLYSDASATRTCYLYVAPELEPTNTGTVTMTIFAHLQDGSAPDASAQIVLTNSTVSGNPTDLWQRVPIMFKSATTTRLIIRAIITQNSAVPNGGNVGVAALFRCLTVA